MGETNTKDYRKGDRLFCRKDFPFSGRPFKKGDLFPAKRLAVSSKKIQQLLNANYLTQNIALVPAANLNKCVIKHRGGGWYDVRKGQEKLNVAPVRKNKAEALAKANE